MRAVLVGVVVGGAWLGSMGDAGAICREVGEPGEPPPTIEPDQSVLIVKREDVVIGQTCEPVGGADAGPIGPDGGGIDAGAPDAAPVMSLMSTADGGIADAGAVDAGAPDAGVVCEEIRGPAIRMVVQPRFRTGPDGAQFALLMVTPADPVIALEDSGVFDQLAEETKQLVVVEDVCIETSDLGYQCKDPQWPSVTGACADPPPRPPPPPPDDDPPPSGGGGGGGGGGGCCGGGGYGDDDDDDWFPYSDASPWDIDAGPPPVQMIGAYDVVEIRTPLLSQLALWLATLGYAVESADLEALAPYVEAGWTVIAVRVSVADSFTGALEPLSFTYPGDEIRLPLGVSKQPPPAEAHLAVYIAADGRYDVPGATQTYAQWTSIGGGSFLTRNNLWADLSRGAEEDPVAMSISGDPTYRDTVTVEREIRIPSSECPYPDAGPPPPDAAPPPDADPPWPPPADTDDDDYPGCHCRAADFPTPGGALLIGLVGFALLRRRRRRRR